LIELLLQLIAKLSKRTLQTPEASIGHIS
jgi:hypothetical protein